MARMRPVLAPVFRIPERRITASPEAVATLFVTQPNSASPGRRAT
jgi:hypothetical protein